MRQDALLTISVTEYFFLPIFVNSVEVTQLRILNTHHPSRSIQMKDRSTGLTVVSSTPVSKQCLKTIRALFDLGAELANPMHPSLKCRTQERPNCTAKCFKG